MRGVPQFGPLLAALVASTAFAACEPPPVAEPVPDTVIDFEQDTVGEKAPGFTSADSPLVHFTTEDGRPHTVYDTQGSPEGEGDRSIYAGREFSPADVGMVLDRPTNRMSLRFGYDRAATSEPGDEAVLTVYRDGIPVGESRVVMNRNSVMDQTISFQNGPLFDAALFRYDTSRSTHEVVDHITFGPFCTKAGTEASETLTGTGGKDVICGGGGNDTIFGRGGDDHISGGNGVDTLHGEGGADFLAGNFGNDTIRGGSQNDRIEGGQQDDTLYGDAGDDTLAGGPGTDRCTDGSGSTTFLGCETQVS